MAYQHVRPEVPPSGTGCAECEEVGGWWMHLRRCTECGHVGCCDSSPSRHASGHFRETEHPVVQSFEPGEDWGWDYARRARVRLPPLTPPTSRPEEQPSPGPEGRVPEDWRAHLH